MTIYKNTGEICMVHIAEDSAESGFRSVDLGSYYIKKDTGEKVLITSRRLAEKYAHLVHVPVYISRID